MSAHVGHQLIRCCVRVEVPLEQALTFWFTGRALMYESEINTFVTSRTNKDLRHLELSEEEWASIRLVCDWLEHFRQATTDMSTTKRPMLSHTHAIFRGLQDHVRDALRNLPSNVDPRIKEGLVAAHQKLSEYYYRFDQSPFYIWAARMYFLPILLAMKVLMACQSSTHASHMKA